MTDEDLKAKILLDVRSPWLMEFAAALAKRIEVKAFSASPGKLGFFSDKVLTKSFEDPSLEVTDFPVQQGYFSSQLISRFFKEHTRIAKWMLKEPSNRATTWLVCCYPHYSKVAALWPGPVAYYATDLFSAYEGRSYRNVKGMETDLCRRAALVCPNSNRVADYLIEHCDCNSAKICILPNAARGTSILAEPTFSASELPTDCRNVSRPIAGVIGNMGANINWVLLGQVVEASPWLSWVFVGPFSAPIADATQSAARSSLLNNRSTVKFVGPKPYGDLVNYARGFDVAVLPYMKREPTFSGSSTRFYEHLAACRPILATDGFAELFSKQPLVKILSTQEAWISQLCSLRDRGFVDGFEQPRWERSRQNTWRVRAECLCDAMLAAGDALAAAKTALSR